MSRQSKPKISKSPLAPINQQLLIKDIALLITSMLCLGIGKSSVILLLLLQQLILFIFNIIKTGLNLNY